MERLFLLALLLASARGDLPSNFYADSYNLALSIPSDVTAAVNGTVVIKLVCKSDTTSIFLHWGSSLTPRTPTASNLTISYLAPGDTDPTQVLFTATVNSTTEQLNISTSTPFKSTGVVTVTASFQTALNNDNKALFLRQYPIENNISNNIYLTNLRPMFARQLFPCLDEPQYNASITLKLTYPQSWSVAATAQAKSTVPGEGTNTTEFNPTVIPPNNLAFFLASNMSNTPYSVERSPTTLSFWARKGLDSTILSANIQFLAQYYYSVEDLLGFSLPITQLTVVMVPGLEEPYAGYGVIFIREENYTQSYWSPQMEGMFKRNVVPVLYQFLRQFTEFSTRPMTWSDYWISPAIANYLQYIILNTVMPPFDFTTDLEVSARQSAMALDSLPDTRPLWDPSVNTDSTASVQAMLNDPQKNLKGAAILNMLDQSLPAGTVFQQIKSFLMKNSNTSVKSADFLSQLQSISAASQSAKLALATTLGYWFNSTVNPLETVKVVGLTGQGTLGQVNFTTTGYCSLLNPSCSSSLPQSFYLSATVGSKTDNRYYVPRQNLWVTNDSVVKASIDVQAGDWVVANVKSAGYYRSTYDNENWERIISALSSNEKNLVDRSQVLDDAFALTLGSSQPLDYNITLRLALANMGSVLYRDWIPVQRGLRDIKNNLLGLAAYTSYQKFAAGYFYNLDGFLRNTSFDPFEAARIRALFLEDMCDSDVAGYRVAAVANLTLLLKGNAPNTVPSSAYDSVACCGAAYSSLKAQDLWNILSDSTLDFYRRRYASIALGCLSNYTDVSQFITIMTKAPIQLKPYMQITLEKVADRNPVLFLANFTKLASNFSSQLGAASVASLIVRAGRKINNNTQASVLDEVINNMNVDPEVRGVAQVTKVGIGYRVNWLSSNNATLVAALQGQAPAGAPSSGGVSLALSSILLTLPAILTLLLTA